MTVEEVFTKTEELASSFLELSFYSGSERHQAYLKLVTRARIEFGENGVRYLTTLLAVSNSKRIIVEGDLIMNDNKIVQHGGSMAGVTAGGSIWAANITSANQVIDQAKSMDGDVKSALQGLLAYVEKAQLEDDQKEDVTTMASRIANQLGGQPKPDEGKVRRSLDTIKSILGTASTVVALTTAIGKLFGWGAAAAAS